MASLKPVMVKIGALRRRLLVCTLCGALACVATAWSLVWLPPSSQLLSFNLDVDGLLSDSFEDIGRGRHVWVLNYNYPHNSFPEKPRQPTVVPASFPSYVGIPGPIRNAVRTEALGWPFLCLRSRWWFNQVTNQDEFDGTLPISDHRFPLTPIWLGFAGNVLVFGAPVFVAWTSVAAAHNRSRRRADRCIKCGFALRGLAEPRVCPECGHAANVPL